VKSSRTFFDVKNPMKARRATCERPDRTDAVDWVGVYLGTRRLEIDGGIQRSPSGPDDGIVGVSSRRRAYRAGGDTGGVTRFEPGLEGDQSPWKERKAHELATAMVLSGLVGGRTP
jgi:hypothetical protein